MNKPITFGSLFAGVGGIDLGLEAAGWRCGFQVEWDKNCLQTLNYHWPDVPKWGDVSDVNGAELPPVDVITFGSPCQDLSVAGKRAGLDGARSGLFHQAIRIINEMRIATNGKYPSAAIWENVPGALSSRNGKDFGAVLDEMAKLRPYSLEWAILDAQYFGVPQRRRRVYVVAILNSPKTERGRRPIFDIAEGRRRNTKTSRRSRETTTADITPSITADSRNALNNGVAACLRSGGEGGIPSSRGEHLVIEPTGYTGSSFGAYREGVGTLRANGGDLSGGSETLIVESPETYVKTVRSGARDADGNLPPEVWADQPIAPTLNSFDNGGDSRATVLVIDGTRVNDVRVTDDQTAITLKRRMGTGGNNVPFIAKPDPVTATAIPIHNQATRFSTKRGDKADGKGNGLGIGEDGDAMNTLTGNDQHYIAQTIGFSHTQGFDPQPLDDGTPTLRAGGGGMAVAQNMTVRRLTPVECERLQGWPDNHTLYRADGKTNPDSTRYKMTGNGVAAPVAKWIAEQLTDIIYDTF